MVTSFRECCTEPVLGKLKTIDQRLATKFGIEEEPFVDYDIINVLEQLLIGEGAKTGGGTLRLNAATMLLEIQFPIFHCLGYLLSQIAVFLADGAFQMPIPDKGSNGNHEQNGDGSVLSFTIGTAHNSERY